ncbi:MAG: DUF5615 family PIN-like protein [Planctomycetes bacterium]|nr:DUF5615 family PIN-like protein [Planctomycetota bacterium]
MNIVAAESVDRQIVEQLRLDGHEVVFIAETSPGARDDEVLDLARDRGALLLTASGNFAPRSKAPNGTPCSPTPACATPNAPSSLQPHEPSEIDPHPGE